MSGRSSPASRTALAFYNRALSCWKMSQQSLASLMGGEEDSTSLPRLPNWGTTADGVLYGHPIPPCLLHTDALDGSALLTTPVAHLGGCPARAVGDPERWHDPERSNELSDQVAALLPTPQAWDANRGPDNSRLRGDGLRPSGQQGTLNLAGAIHLLTGDGSPPPLNDGNESSDAQRPHPPTTGNSQAGSSK